MMRFFLLGAVLFIAGLRAYAVDTLDTLSPSVGTQPVAVMGGDTPNTYQVTCNISSATLARAAVTANTGVNQPSGRPLRKRCFQAGGIIPVVIGSSTTVAADFWVLQASNTAGAQSYCTSNSGAWYCGTPLGTSSGTLNIIEETQSYP